MEISNGDKVFELLKERLDTIERKLDSYAANHSDIRANFAACQSGHRKESEAQVAAIRWLFGIVAVIIASLVVQVFSKGR